jgi:xylan 1,4-beta-xylosidase
MAAWNLFLPEEAGEEKRVTIQISGSAGIRHATIQRLDASHGSLLHAYAEMGKPAYPTPAQIQALRNAAKLPAPESVRIHQNQLMIVMPPQGLALIEFR